MMAIADFTVVGERFLIICLNFASCFGAVNKDYLSGGEWAKIALGVDLHKGHL